MLSRNLLRIGLIGVLLTSSGCSTVLDPLKVMFTPTQLEKAPRQLLPPPRPLELIEHEPWHVITLDGVVYFAIRPKDYEIMAKNNAELLRYLRDTTDHIRYLRSEP
jgi:hypothetical protein